jgi:hypothetical protein
VPVGRFLTPEQGPQGRHISRDQVRSATVPKTRSPSAPQAKIRFRLYLAWNAEWVYPNPLAPARHGRADAGQQP